MTVEERSRRELQEALMGTIGPDPTDTLFSYLPPTGWADVATVHDVATLGIELRSEINSVRTELNSLRTEITSEINSLRTEVKSDIASLRSEVKSDIASLRGEFKIFRSELTSSMHRELRMQFYWTVTLAILIMALVVAIPASGVFE